MANFEYSLHCTLPPDRQTPLLRAERRPECSASFQRAPDLTLLLPTASVRGSPDRGLALQPGSFSDPVKLLMTCAQMGLEGIVSKRRDSSYRPGQTKDWLKAKTAVWRAANRDRFELLHKSKRERRWN